MSRLDRAKSFVREKWRGIKTGLTWTFFLGLGGLISSVHVAALTNRPYVGPVGYNLVYCDGTKHTCPPVSSFQQANNLQIEELFKNTGSIPAENVTVNQRVFLDGQNMQVDGKDRPSRILAGASFAMKGETGMRNYDAILSGIRKLKIQTTIKYEWSGGSEERCYETLFAPESQSFLDLGDCILNK